MMKKRYMRYLALLLTAALALGACGQTDGAEETTETAEETEETTTLKTVLYADLVSTVTSLGEYKGLSAERTVAEITDDDVQQELRSRKNGYATLTEVDRPAEEGDVVLIDYTGYVDGETLDGMQATDCSLELGSDQFVPGFEDQLIGAEADGDYEVNITFPENYYEDLAGRDARFEVHVQTVSEYQLEDWGDEFIQENFGYENEAELTEAIRTELEDAAEEDAESEYEYQLLQTVLDAGEYDVQEADITAYTDEMLSEYETYAAMYGTDLATFLETYVGTDEETLREMYHDTAVFRVKMILTLHEIASLEGLSVSDEEYQEKLQSVADQYGYEDTSAVESVYTEESIREQLLQEKAMNLIVENAQAL